MKRGRPIEPHEKIEGVARCRSCLIELTMTLARLLNLKYGYGVLCPMCKTIDEIEVIAKGRRTSSMRGDA